MVLNTWFSEYKGVDTLVIQAMFSDSEKPEYIDLYLEQQNNEANLKRLEAFLPPDKLPATASKSDLANVEFGQLSFTQVIKVGTDGKERKYYNQRRPFPPKAEPPTRRSPF